MCPFDLLKPKEVKAGHHLWLRHQLPARVYCIWTFRKATESDTPQLPPPRGGGTLVGTPIAHSQKTAATPCTVQAEIRVPVAHNWPSRNRSSCVCLCLGSRLQDAGDKGLHRTSSFEKAQAQRCQGLSDSPLFQPDLSLPLTDGRMS